MKKMTIYGLVIGLLIGTIAGCGGGSADSNQKATLLADGEACTAAWSASTVYGSAGIEVSRSGRNYTSAFLTQSQDPLTNSGPSGSGQPWITGFLCGGSSILAPTPALAASCSPSAITPYMMVSGGSWQQTSSATVTSGTAVTFGPQPSTGGVWNWAGCGTGGTSRQQTVTISNSCTATATYTNTCGAASTQAFNVSVSTSTNSYSLSSPNGQISVTVTRNATSGALSYSVAKGGAILIENSSLGINTNVADFGSGLAFVGRDDSTINENYSLPGHKKTTYTNNAREMVLRFSKSDQNFHLVVRAYDDGMAYRYRVPGTGSLSVSSENSAFNLPDAAKGWAETYNSTYETTYPARSNFNAGNFGLPLLASVSGQWLLLTESDIGGSYHASHLTGSSGNNLKIVWPTATAVNGTRTFNSPWRAAVIGSLGNIVESTLMENLSAPSAIASPTWVQPGSASWSWIAAGATETAQSNYNTHLGYIDIASSLGWKYYLVDDGWQSSWIPNLASYAGARNVGLWLWVHNKDVKTESAMRTKFSQWAGWGVRGIKVDFFDDETQNTMQLYDTLARVAADYHLMINFHGCTKPNGLVRKWPNVLTQEAVAGAEQGNMSALHNISLIFTRNAIGPMDYTPVIYRDAGGNTTWAHQTALAVAFSSYVQHYADHWASYRAGLTKDFLSKVPTIWDETHLLEGQPDQYATVIRRNGGDWYVGALTVGARTAPIPLSFLTPGVTYTAHIYRDGTSNDDIAYETRSVTSASSMNLALRANGGAAVRITTAQTTPVISGKYYKIINRNSGKALAVQSAAMNDGAPVVQWDYADPTTNDEWRLFDLGGGYVQLINRNSGETLDVIGNASAAGSAAAQEASRGTLTQQWQIIDAGGGYSTIRNRNSGQVLDVSGAGIDNGTSVVQWPSSNTANQQWQLIQVQTIP